MKIEIVSPGEGGNGGRGGLHAVALDRLLPQRYPRDVLRVRPGDPVSSDGAEEAAEGVRAVCPGLGRRRAATDSMDDDAQGVPCLMRN